MRGVGPKRRLRVRRKRKGERLVSRADVGEAVATFVDAAGPDGAVEVVGHLGCCVFEAVGSLAVLVALVSVPAFLLLR